MQARFLMDWGLATKRYLTETALYFPVPEEPGHLHLLVKDDGVGLPDGFDAQRLPSLGWKIIQSLAAQLSGRLTHGPADGPPDGTGTRIDLRFPA